MKAKLEELQIQALAEIAQVDSSNCLNEIRVRYLGKKGSLTVVLRGMGALEPKERPLIGQLANQIRAAIEAALNEKATLLAAQEQAEKLAKEAIDIYLPGRLPQKGYSHPVQEVMEEIEELFLGMGFIIAEGPEIESDYYSFEALNLPKDHPARDMQDTFYIQPETVLLRPHTSPIQIRAMERLHPNPIRLIAPGRVYRRDSDATHSPMFHQVEGLVVDEGITFGDLKGVIIQFLKKLFGAERQVRFRPSFFPFTEPSAEVDVSCSCLGKGCRVCKGTGWLEILGSGSVNPVVLEMAQYDPDKVSGFAFGMGIERIAMLKYGITDIRLLYENDLRMLAQF